MIMINSSKQVYNSSSCDYLIDCDNLSEAFNLINYNKEANAILMTPHEAITHTHTLCCYIVL